IGSCSASNRTAMNANSPKSKRKGLIAAAIVILVAIGIWTLQQQQPAKLRRESGTVVLRDVLLLAQTQISSFDPLDAFHEGHIQIVKQTYETLTDVDEHGNCVPLLAAKWETTDNKLWRFYIKTDVLFATSPCFASQADRRLK